MRPTCCFQTNHSKHKTSYNFVHWHAKNTWFLVQKSQIVSKNHDNVVSIVLYWTFLGLSAPYEVVERSCAFFCILIYFTRYKMYMCVGIGSSLNLLPFSNRLPFCDFRWQSTTNQRRFQRGYYSKAKLSIYLPQTGALSAGTETHNIYLSTRDLE